MAEPFKTAREEDIWDRVRAERHDLSDDEREARADRAVLALRARSPEIPFVAQDSILKFVAEVRAAIDGIRKEVAETDQAVVAMRADVEAVVGGMEAHGEKLRGIQSDMQDIANMARACMEREAANLATIDRFRQTIGTLHAISMKSMGDDAFAKILADVAGSGEAERMQKALADIEVETSSEKTAGEKTP